jgi:RimJ/RimL family protein N-acetyltransferase
MELVFLKKEEKIEALQSIRDCLKDQEQLCDAWVYVNGNNKIIKIVNDEIVVGYIFLSVSSNGIAEIDIVMHPKYRHQGHGTKALELLSEYAKNSLGIEVLCAHVLINNYISRKCFEANGFEVDPDNSDSLLIRYIKNVRTKSIATENIKRK